MDSKLKSWLPHLIDAIPVAARKNHTSLYAIALEGWRRGMGVTFFNDNRNRIGCSLIYDGRSYPFIGSSGELITDEIVDICDDKGKTNDFLSGADVPIPLGREFDESSTDDDIMAYADEIKYPVVLKPTDGRAGRGVYAGITNPQELEYALKSVRDKLGYKNILLQQYVTGDEVRIYVLDGRVLAASNRKPANILGDGNSTVKELIARKNELRKKVPSLYFRPINIDKEVHTALKSKGHTLESIPKKGERILLRRVSNLSKGGESIDITDMLTEEQKSIAIRATQAIPGLVQCGVDMIINEQTGSGVVLELNTRPGIGNHLFPVEGQATDIPKEIVDFYIPDTKGMKTDDSNVYFEFKNIIETLKEKTTEQIDVCPYPGRLITHKIVVDGEVNLLLLYNKIQSLAFGSGLHGCVEPDMSGGLTIVVGSTSDEGFDGFLKQLRSILEEHKLTIAEVVRYTSPVLVGFRLLDTASSMSLKKLRAEVKETAEKRRSIEKEKTRINRRIQLMQQSMSWKISRPIRMVSNKFKSLPKN